MFISIINDSFQLARKKENNNPKIFSYMFKKFLHWTRLKKPTLLEMAEEYDRKMRSKYIDPIEYLPDKIDQLIEALDRFQTTDQH